MVLRMIVGLVLTVAAHAAVFWGFVVLLLTIIEAYGALFQRTFAIPGIGLAIWGGLRRTSGLPSIPFGGQLCSAERPNPW